MAKELPGIEVLKDLHILKQKKRDLFKDIRELNKIKKQKSKTALNIEFKKFKKNYPELFSKTGLRNWNKKDPTNALAQIRRAYNQGKKSNVSKHRLWAQELEEDYKDYKPPQGPVKPPPKINIMDILTRYGQFTFLNRSKGYGVSKMINPQVSEKRLWQILKLSANEIRILNLAFTHYRVAIEIAFKSGGGKWVSTPRMRINKFGNDTVWNYFFNKKINAPKGQKPVKNLGGLQSRIWTEDPYTNGAIEEIVDYINKVEIYWMK